MISKDWKKDGFSSLKEWEDDMIRRSIEAEKELAQKPKDKGDKTIEIIIKGLKDDMIKRGLKLNKISQR